MSISSVTPFQPLHPAWLCMPVFSRYACISARHPSDVSFSKRLPSIRTHLGRYTSHNMRSVIRPAQTESNSKPARKWNESLQKSQARPAAINPSLFLKTETPKRSKFHLCHNNGSNTACSCALREQLRGGDRDLLNNIISHLTGGSKNERIPTQKTFHAINPVSDSLRPWSRRTAAEVFAFQTGLFPTYQVRMIPVASPSRALSRLGVRGRAFKNAALPFQPFQDSSFDFGAVVNEELVEPEDPEVSPRHSQGVVRMPALPRAVPSPILRSSRCPFSCRGPALPGSH